MFCPLLNGSFPYDVEKQIPYCLKGNFVVKTVRDTFYEIISSNKQNDTLGIFSVCLYKLSSRTIVKLL